MRLPRSAALLVAFVVLTACGGADSGIGARDGSTSLTVASSDFPESKILAEIYAQSLELNGFTVARKQGIGSRETYLPAMLDGSVDLVADYAGNLLHHFDKETAATTLPAIMAELAVVLPPSLKVLEPSSAVDTDTLTVTRDTAKNWNLKSIADLKPHEKELRIAAPPEFLTRPHGIPGLAAKYGIRVSQENFVGISDGGGPATVRALLEGNVTAADIFSSLPAIPQHNLVVLDDPNHLFLANNVVPLVAAAKDSEALRKVLNIVSAKLTTAGLIGLNTAVAGNSGVSPEDAAKLWLKDTGLDHPAG